MNSRVRNTLLQQRNNDKSMSFAICVAPKLSAPWEDRTPDLGISPTYKYHALTNCANGAQLPFRHEF
uniref:Uncharacterized protein n=2 Tax=Heterorhabditis bacteriophora TaxID=37862 RepID=A0A1I7X5Y7_HETBA